MNSESVAGVDVEDGFTEQEVLGAAASALQATAFRNGRVDATRLSPLANAVADSANAEGAAIVVPSAPVEGMLPAVRVDIQGQTVALSSVSYDKLAVEIEGVPAGTIRLEPGSELYGHAIVTPGVRSLTPIFNIYGTVMLVGGAIYSAWIFWRKRIMPNRVLGNVLIATGALMPATGGLLSRFGLSGYLYASELLGAVIIFGGFLVATNRPESAPTVSQRPAEVQGR
jgi:hypothetical protein